MAKLDLEKAISEAAGEFALNIIQAVKGATLQELIALQAGGNPSAAAILASETAVKRGPGRPKKVVVADGEAPAKKKRVVKNYPKCAYPGCTKNRFVRGKGFCGDHWRMWLAGKIKSADAYQKAAKKTAAAKTAKKKKKK